MAALAWGSLHAQTNSLHTTYLHNETYTFGTSPTASINLISLGQNGISPNHFTITRDLSDRRNPQPVFLTNHSANGTYVNQELVATGKRRILKTNDTIAMCQPNRKIFVFYDYIYPCISTVDMPCELLAEYFVEPNTIGKGHFGAIHVVHHLKTCEKFAVKRVKKQPFTEDNETKLMRKLNHPCILKLISVAHTPQYKFIVMGLMAESLDERIDRSNGFLPEDEVKVIFMQMAKAIEHMHGLKIVHRDIKSKNTMLMTKDQFAHVKLIDFGLTKTDSNLISFCGSPL